MSRSAASIGLILAAISFSASGKTVTAGQANSENVYAGQNITLIVGSSAGGGYDAYARLLSRHIRNHIPGQPSVSVQNMPGASGVRAVNHVYNVAPRDGSVFTIGNRTTLVEPVFGSEQVKIDARKLSWIGGLNTEWSVGIATPESGLTSIEVAREREFPVSASGASSDGYVYAAILNSVLGTRFKIITGYPGTAEEQIAMQRGEVAGRVGWAWGSIQATAKHLVDSGKLKPFVVLAPAKQTGLDIPLARDFAKSDADKAVLDFAFAPQLYGRPFFAPPAIPRNRHEALKGAFRTTASDEAFLGEAAKLQLDIEYVSPERLQELSERLYATPQNIVARTKLAREGRGF